MLNLSDISPGSMLIDAPGCDYPRHVNVVVSMQVTNDEQVNSPPRVNIVMTSMGKVFTMHSVSLKFLEIYYEPIARAYPRQLI